MMFKPLLSLIALLSLSACVATGSAPGASSAPKEAMNSGSVIALNYSGKEISYVSVRDPNNPNNRAGGEGLNPYDSGGMICCYRIPSVWHPGIMARVVLKLTGVDTPEQHLVEIPPYPDGIPGDVWPMRLEDGSVALVVSTYMPNHPKWNGPVKGYPVPSKEYQRVLWEKEVKFTKNSIATWNDLLNDTSRSAEQQARTARFLEQDTKKLKYLMEHKP
jgi:hypothetical protein